MDPLDFKFVTVPKQGWPRLSFFQGRIYQAEDHFNRLKQSGDYTSIRLSNGRRGEMKTIKSPIRIKLTKKQLKELEPIFAIVNHECAAGRKGMAVGQAYEDGALTIGFVPVEIANKLLNKGPVIERVVPE